MHELHVYSKVSLSLGKVMQFLWIGKNTRRQSNTDKLWLHKLEAI
jgi:hypothetical protein